MDMSRLLSSSDLGLIFSFALVPALTYVQTGHRCNAPFTPKVLLCGPLGSGKSLQAALLAQRYGLVDSEYLTGSVANLPLTSPGFVCPWLLGRNSNRSPFYSCLLTFPTQFTSVSIESFPSEDIAMKTVTHKSHPQPKGPEHFLAVHLHVP